MLPFHFIEGVCMSHILPPNNYSLAWFADHMAECMGSSKDSFQPQEERSLRFQATVLNVISVAIGTIGCLAIVLGSVSFALLAAGLYCAHEYMVSDFKEEVDFRKVQNFQVQETQVLGNTVWISCMNAYSSFGVHAGSDEYGEVSYRDTWR